MSSGRVPELKVKINNSTCRVEGLSAEGHKNLAKVLSYTPAKNYSAYAGANYSRSISLLTRRGEFPTGLLYLVRWWTDHYRLPVRYIDERALPKPLKSFPEAKLSVPSGWPRERGRGSK